MILCYSPILEPSIIIIRVFTQQLMEAITEAHSKTLGGCQGILWQMGMTNFKSQRCQGHHEKMTHRIN